MKRIFGRIALVILGLLLINMAQSQTIPPPSPQFSSELNSFFNFAYWPPRITGWGLGGRHGMAIGDGMVPLFSSTASMLYADGQGRVNTDKNWLGSIGTGYRQIYRDERILGAYVFFDRNEFFNSRVRNSYFWFVNPGVESLGNQWDFRVNGYIPISQTRRSLGTFFGDQIGINTFVTFSGHQEFDQIFTVMNETSTSSRAGKLRAGVDGEVGHIFHFTALTYQPRAYIGGYYFPMQDVTDIKGVSGRIELPLDHHVAIVASDSYDNFFHNSAAAGLRVTFGGMPDDQCGIEIQRRMLDPIQRNLATLSTTQGTGQPVVKIITRQQTNTSTQQQILERDNIYFFTGTDGSPFDGTTNSCTFNSPCAANQFTQGNVNIINGLAPGTNFFFNPGTFPLAGALTLNNGQSMFGRTPDFTLPASPGNLPLFTGGLTLLGNNTLDSFELINDGSQTTGINVNGDNVAMNNIVLGSTNIAQSYQFGIALNAVQNITINNPTILITRSDIGIPSAIVASSSSVSVNGGTINVTNSAAANVITFAIQATNSLVNLTGTTLSNTNITPNVAAEGLGINAINSTVNVNNSTISVSSSAGSAAPGGAQVVATAIFADNSVINVSNSMLIANANYTGGSPATVTIQADGISAMNNSAITVNNDQFLVTASSPNATGGTIAAFGIRFNTGSTLTLLGNNMFSVSIPNPGGATPTMSNIFNG